MDRNTFYASYWAKRDSNKIRLGVNYIPLNDELRRQLERNTGVQAVIVVRGTPAFKANILEGIFLLKLNGKDIVDVPSLSDRYHQNGRSADYLRFIARRPVSLDRSVTLNP